jgi:hypothetical protein
MGQQADTIVRAVCQWLHAPLPGLHTHIVVFSPDELQDRIGPTIHGRGQNRVGGLTDQASHIMVVGDPNQVRFWTVLRHETAHCALQHAAGRPIPLPFWLDEGVACLFEMGVDSAYQPRPNPERVMLLRYLIRTQRSLRLNRFIQKPFFQQSTGQNYTRAWGIVATLYDQGRSLETYIEALPVSSDGQLAHFKNTLLDSNEDLQDFELAIKRFAEP